MDKRKLLALCELVRDGDSAAIEKLYEYIYVPLFRYCWGLAGSKEDAEDLTHDTFMKAVAKLETLKHDNIEGWMMTIAKNVFIDQKRSKKYEVDEIDDELATDDGQQLPDLDKEYNEKELVKAMQGLSTIEREALVLSFWFDNSAKQVAEKIGKSHDATRQLLSRTLKKLKNKLATKQ